MVSIRGAITIDNDSEQNVLKATRDLLENMILKNNVDTNDITNIIFTCTSDIKSAYPAVAARNIGILDAGLICVNEMLVENSLRLCIRVLMNINIDISQKDVKHIYMGKAKTLRPDLVS